MSDQNSRVDQDRELLRNAHERGVFATLGAYTRLSGPGWLQSAITLGGGSLAGALFLGILGGTKLIWLQLVAIIMGVIMLSAISYVTLSTGKRPFREINAHINPVLGWGWLIATCMANMIWCMPQFSLCYAALHRNLLGPERIGESRDAKLMVSAILLAAAAFVVVLNSRHGIAAKVFDAFLKMLVGLIVVCFMGVVVLLAVNGQLNWSEILAGFIPDFSTWNRPTGQLADLLSGLSESDQTYWQNVLVTEQRAVMIGAAATAVGINMTFLMPYTLLNRGWDKTFRGLARFDLSTGMAIPYVIVTSCVVIAAAQSFHAKVDNSFLSDNPAVVQESPIYAGAEALVQQKLQHDLGDQWPAMSSDEHAEKTALALASMPEGERRVVASLVRRDAFQLSQALAPLLGEQRANLVFGIGIFGMGFSTIIILMLINGFAFCEIFDKPLGGTPLVVGCLIAGAVGALWPVIWDGPAKLWLAILASSFGMMLLPIAYVTFFMMMNNRKLMGDAKPTGLPMLAWNLLMGISVLGAFAAALAAIREKIGDPVAGRAVIVISVGYVLLVIAGFFWKPNAASSVNASN